MRSIRTAVLTTTLLSLLPAAVADAKDYCVAKPRCSGPVLSATQLQAALTEAQSNGTADRILLGDALFAGGPYVYDSAEPVEIVGVSGTTLQARSDDRTILSVTGAAATVRDLKLELDRPTSAGLKLAGGSASGITVVQTLGTVAGVGVLLNDGASLTAASIAMLGDGPPAVGTLSGSAVVSDSVVDSAGAAVMVAGPSAQLTVRRATIVAPLGVQVLEGRAVVRDTLIDGRAVGAGGITAGLFVAAQGGDVGELDAARVTIAGSGEDAANAIGAYAAGFDGGTATLRIADSAITRAGIPLVRFAERGTATVVADRVAHRDRVAGEPFDTGPGTTTETNRLPAPTGFADAARGDFHLLPGSPLVDAGDPAFAPDASSDRDLSGAPRLADGDGDCTPRVDVGAFELQPGGPCHAGTPAPPAAPPATPTPIPPASRVRAGDRTPPTVTNLRAPARFVAGRALPQLRVKRTTPAFTFTLSEPATVRLQFARRGRDGRFHAVRTTVTVRTGQGGSRLGFAGRLTRRARLSPGSYRVTFVATDANGNHSQAASVRFRLVAPTR